jgi:hypothetical protein
MKKISILIPLVLALVLSIGIAVPVSATPNTKLDLFYDGVPGTGEIDMDGPTMGFVNTNQDDEANLRVVVKVKGALPLTEYTIYLVGGITHDAVTGFIAIGTLTTDEYGNGNSGSIWVDAATIADAPLNGVQEYHIDLLCAAQGYAATTILYIAP